MRAPANDRRHQRQPDGPAATMRELRAFTEAALARRLPSARLLYWT